MILDACIGGVITHTGKVLAGWRFGKPKVDSSRNSMKINVIYAKTYLVVPTLIKAASVTPLVRIQTHNTVSMSDFGNIQKYNMYYNNVVGNYVTTNIYLIYYSHADCMYNCTQLYYTIS